MKFKKELFIFFIAALLLPALVAAYPALVPRTGQTVSIFERDDGDLQAGVAWPDPRFSDHGDAVTDNLTGLMWPKNANLLGTVDADNDTDGTGGDGLVTWQHALDYVAKLNRESYLGYSDWRLPNVNELESLADAGTNNPALPSEHLFTDVQSSWYWASTSHALGTVEAWMMDMTNGMVYQDNKAAGLHYVLPVRAGQCGAYAVCLPKTGQTASYATGDDGDAEAGTSWPDPRFTVSGDAVTDNLTGLMWTKDACLINTRNPDNDTDGNPGDGAVTWEHAFGYVKKLNNESYLGFTDWRLPNKKELRSLADYSRSPALPAGHPFTNVKSSSYWTSSFSISDIWIVHFINGQAVLASSANLYHVWPVRAGHFDPIITTSTTSTSIPLTSSTSTTSIAATTTISAAVSTTTTSAAVSTTTTSIEDKKCPIARTLGQDSPDLDNLRAFRDGTLSRSAAGRKIIQLYYHSAESINAALEKSPELRAFTRGMLKAVAPMMGKRGE
jgi:hypothetical protein